MTFELNPNFREKAFVLDLPLCRVLLEDESHYPWIMLIPRRMNCSRIMDLRKEDQLQLLEELDWAQRILWENFQPKQLNVAALGNKTPQLHVHVIARWEDDPAWPQTVWDHPDRVPYSHEQKNEMIQLLVAAFDTAIRLGSQVDQNHFTR